MNKKAKEKRLPVKERFALLRYFIKLALKENKIAVFWLFFCNAPLILFPFITMIFPKLIIDELLGERRISYLAAWVIIMISSETLLRFFHRYAQMRQQMARDCFDNYIERCLSAKVMKMKFSLTENPKAMDHYQKAYNGFDYSGGISMLLSDLSGIVTSIVTMIGVVGIISAVSPFLLLISVVAVAVSMTLTSMEIKINIHYYNLGPKLDRIFDYLFNNLSDLAYGKDLRLYHGIDFIESMGNDATDKLYALNAEHYNKSQAVQFVSVLFNVMKNAVTYGYLGVLAIIGRITIGDFTMMMNAAETFTNDCMLGLIGSFQNIGNNLELMNAYRKFMEYPEEEEGGIALPDSAVDAPLIEFRDVSFRYPDTDHDVLKHLNLTIEPGQHICVVGENGAGKSTFIKLLCRLYPVTKGDILLNGVSIYSYSYREYLKLLSVVFQDFKLFSFTIRDNLALASGEEPQATSGVNGSLTESVGTIEKDEYKNKERLTDQKLIEICKMAGFGERLDQLPKGLDTGLYKNFYEDGIEPSGGEAQKLAIARALCKDAPVVILDEPTAALDPLAEAEIYEHFQQMSKGKTAIFISHRLSSCQFCDRVIVFAGNGIAESGSHKELADKPNGIYAAMFRAQAENYQ